MRGAEAAGEFAASLKAATWLLHGQAERSGFIAAMLRGQVSRAGYALWLRNLLPAYEALEAGLERNRERPGLAGLDWGVLRRAPAIRSDLGALAGPDWEALSLTPEARTYAARIMAVADTAPILLTAHAYVRYLGDLHGGQVIRRILAEALGLGAGALGFYEFAGIADLPAYRMECRAAIAAAGRFGDEAALIAEARTAFGANIALSEALGADLPDCGT